MSDVGDLPVAALAADAVVRVPPDATVEDVARTLVSAEVGLLAVAGDGEPVRAVVSERDVVRAVAEGLDVQTTRARDIASSTVRWCDADATVAEVAEEMMEYYVRHVLLEAEGELVGIVSTRDLLGAYASADAPSD